MPRLKKTETETETQVQDRPKMTSLEWNSYVLDQLRDDEKDPQGHPNIDGLRRLAEDILGDVVYSAPSEHFEGATQANGMRATVVHVVKIAWQGNRDDIRTFGAAADVYSGNTDEEYARYPSATADTRAEARALRKALRLRKVVASEELTSLPVSESGISQYIAKSQERGIEKLCKSLDIDVLAFLNSGKDKYKDIAQIRYITAQAMLEQLNKYMQNINKIPENLVGYDPEWRSLNES